MGFVQAELEERQAIAALRRLRRERNRRRRLMKALDAKVDELERLNLAGETETPKLIYQVLLRLCKRYHVESHPNRFKRVQGALDAYFEVESVILATTQHSAHHDDDDDDLPWASN